MHRYSDRFLCSVAIVLGLCLAGVGGCQQDTSVSPSGSGGDGSGGTTASGGSVGSGGATSAGGSGGTTSGTGGTVSDTGGSATGSGGTTEGSGGRTTGTGGTAEGSGGRTTGTGGSAVGSGGRTTRPGSGGRTSATGGRATGGSTTGAGGSATGGASGGAGGTGTGGTTGGTTGTDPVKSDGCGKTTTAKTGNGQTISINGSNRTYNLKLPDNYDMNKAYKLMVAYHCMNGTANGVTSENFYGLWSLSQNSTVFVAPQGINNAWSNSGGSDVEFSRQLIARLESQICIDKSRVFCEGFSMGGSMSYAMASAAPELIRAIAVHSGGAMSGSTPGHSGMVAYFMTHGTKDSVCTYPNYGVPQLQDFAKVNKCTKPDPTLSASAFEAALPNPTSSASACVEFEGCTDGYPVRSCLFVGDHQWNPGGASTWVPGETWKFLSQF
jgi:poly(3-hydroxybutyrate) depolymerase